MGNTIKTRKYRTTFYPLSMWLVFWVILSLTGCSIQEQKPPQEESTQPSAIPEDKPDVLKTRSNNEQVMVDDLLSALVQLFPPRNSTIQISADDDSELTLLVADTMAHAGFAIQKVTTDQGTSLLTTDTQTKERSDNNLPTKHLRIDIGQISIGRTYSVKNGQTILPSSPFNVYGSRAKIDLGTTLFGTNSAKTNTQYLAPIRLNEPLPLLSLITPDIVQSASNNEPGLPELTSTNSAKVEINNLRFGESTFDSVLSNHLILDELTVLFPNDSLILGNENKLLIREFMAKFIEQLDLVSVVGCSNGPTAVDIGNVGLALGRGERVTNELLSLGVPREKILDQGCWAPSVAGKYPGRGVVLELWREKS